MVEEEQKVNVAEAAAPVAEPAVEPAKEPVAEVKVEETKAEVAEPVAEEKVEKAAEPVVNVQTPAPVEELSNVVSERDALKAEVASLRKEIADLKWESMRNVLPAEVTREEYEQNPQGVIVKLANMVKHVVVEKAPEGTVLVNTAAPAKDEGVAFIRGPKMGKN